MAYTPLDTSKPTTAQTREAAMQSAKNNFAAALDLIVTTGGAPGWDESYSGGTPAQPAVFYWKNGLNWIRSDTTWGTSGGAANKVIKEAYYVSTDGGGTWDPRADLGGNYVATTTYDSNGFWLNTTWGATP